MHESQYSAGYLISTKKFEKSSTSLASRQQITLYVLCNHTKQSVPLSVALTHTHARRDTVSRVTATKTSQFIFVCRFYFATDGRCQSGIQMTASKGVYRSRNLFGSTKRKASAWTQMEIGDDGEPCTYYAHRARRGVCYLRKIHGYQRMFVWDLNSYEAPYVRHTVSAPQLATKLQFSGAAIQQANLLTWTRQTEDRMCAGQLRQ